MSGAVKTSVAAGRLPKIVVMLSQYVDFLAWKSIPDTLERI